MIARLGILGWIAGAAVIVAMGRIGCHVLERGVAWARRRAPRREMERHQPRCAEDAWQLVGWDGRRIDA